METVKELIKYMKKEKVNKFCFKISGLNKGYYYLKLLNENNFQITESILLSKNETKQLFQQLYLKYPEGTILFKIHEIDFQYIEKQEKTIQNITKIKELIQQEQINKEKEILILLNEIVENTTQI